MKNAFDDCIKTFGHIDVVINSAGIACPYLSIVDKEFNNSYLDICLKVNVIGTFIVSKYAAL